MTDLQIVEQFLKQYRNDYDKMLGQVRNAIGDVRASLGDRIVAEIYTRGQKGGDGELKSATEIVAKARRTGVLINSLHLITINDIVGATIVVFYEDHIDEVLRALDRALKKRDIAIFGEPARILSRQGYYATHITCEMTDVDDPVRAEVQIKTTLHDAWSKKMHALTYKPVGPLDPRHEALVALVADTLDAAERQSAILRDLIHENWDVEKEARDAARAQVIEQLVSYHKPLWKEGMDPEIVALGDRVEQSIASDISPVDQRELRKSIDDLARQKPSQMRFIWLLAGRLALRYPSSNSVRFFRRLADTWLEAAEQVVSANGIGDDTGQIFQGEVISVALVFYALGDLELASEYAEKFANDPRWSGLPKSAREKALFNWANFVLEREYHNPSRDEAARDELKPRIEAAVDILKGSTEAESHWLDACGMIKIVFGNTTEEILFGIEECSAAARLEREEVQLAVVYANLNVKLGWRRYISIDNKARWRRAASLASPLISQREPDY